MNTHPGRGESHKARRFNASPRRVTLVQRASQPRGRFSILSLQPRVMQLSFEDNHQTISQKFIQDTSLVTHKFGNAFELGFELRSQRLRA